MASGNDPGVGEAGVRPETRRVHDWVPEGMELRFAYLVNIRRDRYIVDAKNKKKFHGGFDYPLPMDCNWSFRQFGEVICSPYPWGLHDEVEFKYYDGGSKWVKVSNDAELATMFAKHKEKENFHVRLQNDVVVLALRPNGSSRSSRQNNFSVSTRQRDGSTSVGTGRSVPIEVEPDSYNSGDDEERLYSDVVQNLRRTSQAKNQDEAANDVHLVDDEVGEEEDLAAVEWDRENPQMEEGFIFASMSECRNALVTYCIKAERTFEVDKSDQVQQATYNNMCMITILLQGSKPHMHMPYLLWRENNNWDKVDPGFKLCAPILKRAAGRPRKSRIRPRSEGAGLGAKRRKCTRCGGSVHFAKYCDNAVDPAFGESFDENVDTNDNHNEDPNEEENVDPNEEENDDHNEEAPNDDPNDDPSEVPNDGGQTSVVASSARWRGPIELVEAFLTAGFAHLPSGSPVMFRLDEVRDGITLKLLTVTFSNPFDAYDLLGQVFWCGCESIFFTTYNIFTNYESIFPTANQMHSLPYQH
ncbi:hypothetical protein ACQ4PT_068152 [Festuca glaucescens]